MTLSVCTVVCKLLFLCTYMWPQNLMRLPNHHLFSSSLIEPHSFKGKVLKAPTLGLLYLSTQAWACLTLANVKGKNSWMQRNKLFSLQTVKASWGKACSGAQWLSNKVIQVRNKIKVSKRQNINFLVNSLFNTWMAQLSLNHQWSHIRE